MRQFWLAKKSKKKVALYPYVKGKEVKFIIVGTGYEKMSLGFKPENGTISRAVVTCPVCGAMIDANTTRRLFQEGKSGQRMVGVVLHKPGQSGKRYRLATREDLEIYQQAEKYLKEKREKLKKEWGMEPVPDEILPSVGTLGFRIQRYNMNTWGDLFNSRQKLALITFVEKVRNAYKKMIEEGLDKEYAKAVVGYLGLGLTRMSDYFNALCVWDNGQERTVHIFGRQALPMVWDFSELNPLSSTVGGWESMAFRRIWKVIDFLSCIKNNTVITVSHSSLPVTTVTQASATQLPYPDNFFDAVFTDPPYYDNVPYSYLSDFFYVWLKRVLGDVYPELFSTPLTPKKQEIVAYSNGPGGWEDGKAFFEDMLKKSFQEIQRVLKSDGISVIVYAHKSTSGWETLINSLLDSGLVMTGAWPINTEMQARLRANESAALASSIYIIARKMKRASTGFYNDVKGCQRGIKKALKPKVRETMAGRNRRSRLLYLCYWLSN
jgi:adenine-specific DNA methylase